MVYLRQGRSIRFIARHLNRLPSVIFREINASRTRTIAIKPIGRRAILMPAARKGETPVMSMQFLSEWLRFAGKGEGHRAGGLNFSVFLQMSHHILEILCLKHYIYDMDDPLSAEQLKYR